ncbi:hypothetical protein TWF106_002512 [Orbilia oligospora]|uniref:BRCT domain-containing protein n=1 Tax=Orbilia oligospora TaxID=2813651 RepID=A0A7C8UQH5_ORBOL|nr:hypothetical protein TWF106_002512 [Orbilia oligospora]
MEATAPRRSARKHPPSTARLLSKRRRVSAQKTTAKAKAKANITEDCIVVATPVPSKKQTTLKSILKKSVHFASTPRTPALCDKENDCPSEDELVAATITPKPSRSFTPASKKASSITLATTPRSASIKLSTASTPRPLLKKATADLKRKYTPEASPPKSRRKIARLDDIKLNEETDSPVKHLDFRTYTLDMGSANTTLSVKKEKSTMSFGPTFTPRVTSTGIPVYNHRQGLHETPAKRPIKPVKSTPAIRASALLEDADENPNPFHPSAKKAASEAFNMHSVKKASSSRDIFASTDSFVCPAPSSKGWDFEPKSSRAVKGSQLATSLATPARRPPVSSGMLSASTANVNKPNRNFSRSLMSCPPKRPAIPLSPSTPVAKKAVSAPKISDLATPARRPDVGISVGTTKKEDPTHKYSILATPARRPDFGMAPKTPKNDEPVAKASALATPARRPDFAASFAKPTASSMAKSTPTRPSPLKEAPRRPHGLSPLKPAISMDDIKEASSPTYDAISPLPLRDPFQVREESVARSPSPSRIPVKIDQVSPVRPSIFGKSPATKHQGDCKIPPLFKEPLAKSARKAPANTSTPGQQFLNRLFQTERKPVIYRDLDTPPKPASPVNRRLSFTSSPSPKKPTKAEFDIFVDEPVVPPKKEQNQEDLVGDSITTAQVFAKSPPKTLGTRRESGIFLPSPDRAVTIGPFTQRLGGKLSPLRKEYEREITETSGVNLVNTPTGNFFLDTMDARDREIRTPKYVQGKTMIVPLKGCEEEEEEEEEEEDMEAITSRNAGVKDEKAEEESGVLSDIIVFLEVRTSDGADASASFVEDLKKLGAKVVKRWRLNTFGNSSKEINPMGVNLVVFKDGISQTLTKAKRANVPCVGVAWIKECVSQNAKVQFDDFVIERAGLFGVKKQRRNSLVAKLHKCVTPRKTAPGKASASGFNGADGNEDTKDRTITVGDQLGSLTARQQKAWFNADRKAQALMKNVRPAVARQHTQNLMKQGVKTSEAFERTALAWQKIEDGMEAKNK